MVLRRALRLLRSMLAALGFCDAYLECVPAKLCAVLGGSLVSVDALGGSLEDLGCTWEYGEQSWLLCVHWLNRGQSALSP